MKKGDIVYGKITNILGYGAFVQVNNYDGLIHISEFSDHYVRDIKEYVEIGQELKLKIIEIDDANHKLKLSYKQIHKTRGIKCRVPKYKIGFKSIKEAFGEWLEGEKNEESN